MASSVSWGMDFSCSVCDAVWLLCNLVSAASGLYHPHFPFCIPLSLILLFSLLLALSLFVLCSLSLSPSLILSPSLSPSFCLFSSLSLPPYFLSPPFLPLSLSHTHTHHSCMPILSLSHSCEDLPCSPRLGKMFTFKPDSFVAPPAPDIFSVGGMPSVSCFILDLLNCS